MSHDSIPSPTCVVVTGEPFDLLSAAFNDLGHVVIRPTDNVPAQALHIHAQASSFTPSDIAQIAEETVQYTTPWRRVTSPEECVRWDDAYTSVPGAAGNVCAVCHGEFDTCPCPRDNLPLTIYERFYGVLMARPSRSPCSRPASLAPGTLIEVATVATAELHPLLASLVELSCWFEVLPLPDDGFEVVTKAEGHLARAHARHVQRYHIL